jgi:F-type H+-transporting ATPase subunit alpha
VAGTLKIDLAQFRELEAFASFGSELDKVSQAQLDRGYRLTELLKQPLRSPMPVEEQVVSIFAGTRGFIDDIPTGDVRRFEAELLEEFRSRHRDLLDQIRNEGTLPDEAKLTEAISTFKERFQPGEQTEARREEEDLDERTAAGAEAEAVRSDESH